MYPNPLQDNPAYSIVKYRARYNGTYDSTAPMRRLHEGRQLHQVAAARGKHFVNEYDTVPQEIVVQKSDPRGIHFRRGWPCQMVYFEPEDVYAFIVTCGGLCPGLNTVIKDVLHGGYRGFYARNTIPLTPKSVNDVHKRGGTSRGGHDAIKIVDNIQDRGGFSFLRFKLIIGGDGTQKGAAVIFEVIESGSRKNRVLCTVNYCNYRTSLSILKLISESKPFMFLFLLSREFQDVAIAGTPKTTDNDIAVIDKSFGFDTTVEEAQCAINAAHVEAENAWRMNLHLMRFHNAGLIAVYATLASRDVDCCLIPELPFYLEGKGGLFEYIEKRLKEDGHMVIVVAEGAGQELMADSIRSMGHEDASGNKLLLDVGLWLSHKIKDYFTSRQKMRINLEYIDPTYMIRAIPSNASDNIYCTVLAPSAVHGAMAGYTEGDKKKRNKVIITDRMWARLLSVYQSTKLF
ncbi:hypothetical protein C4D60_Mb04t14970 [Musa balbisiana]|uniref:Phosphofructokinase domain-containing protein n=1 Tax=Musa balbisiana TaxID=52838 RepID=A0A4S8KC56_MUSBA|nr:hypothetical protein C4D60_Mb04t14970 [Musa balbisiana]